MAAMRRVCVRNEEGETGLNPTQWLLYERVQVEDNEIIKEKERNDKSDRNVTETAPNLPNLPNLDHSQTFTNLPKPP